MRTIDVSTAKYDTMEDHREERDDTVSCSELRTTIRLRGIMSYDAVLADHLHSCSDLFGVIAVRGGLLGYCALIVHISSSQWTLLISIVVMRIAGFLPHSIRSDCEIGLKLKNYS